MNSKNVPPGFGLIIIGNEILDGRVTDTHFDNTRDLLHARHVGLHYTFILPDDASVIETQIRWAMSQKEPFFCCGGIGSTPDDLTRGCAARAAGVDLEHHPDGVAILKQRFGEDATPARMLMVNFPRGASLVPNPINSVPGFHIRNGYFLPGFPNMAEPMMQWVLDTYYRQGEQVISRKVLLPGAREADLVDLMEQFVGAHSAVSFSSLPRFTADGTEVELGLRGTVQTVLASLEDLITALDLAAITYQVGSD